MAVPACLRLRPLHPRRLGSRAVKPEPTYLGIAGIVPGCIGAALSICRCVSPCNLFRPVDGQLHHASPLRSETSETEAAMPSMPLLKSMPTSLPSAVRIGMATALRCMPDMT